MKEEIIPFSPASLRRRLMLTGAVVVLACIGMSLFFLNVTFAPNLQRFLLVTLWIALPLFWLLDVVFEKKRREKTTYKLTDDALVKEKKGWFGTNTNQLYRYDTIESVNSKSRSNGAYGSVELVFDQDNSLVLVGIERPDEYAREIKRRAADARSSVRVDYARK